MILGLFFLHLSFLNLVGSLLGNGFYDSQGTFGSFFLWVSLKVKEGTKLISNYVLASTTLAFCKKQKGEEKAPYVLFFEIMQGLIMV